MIRSFGIEPYVGVGGLTFGMTVEEVSAVLGPAIRSLKNRAGGLDEVREGVKVCYSSTGTATDFVLFPPAQALYKRVDLLSLPDPIRILVADDPEALESVGIVVFLKLGLTVTGFGQRDGSDKAVTAFTRGRWDALAQELKPYEHA